MDDVMEFPDIDQIKDEAAAWVVKVHGLTYKTGQALSDAQAAELRQWLEQSPVHRDYFLKILGGWDAMGVLEELADILPLSDSAPSEVAAPTFAWLPRFNVGFGERVFAMPVLATAGFACAVLLSLAVLLAPQSPVYVTGIGEQALYTLDDGTVLKLNTNSEVLVNYQEHRRAVTLLRGEANFDVAKNKQRPFVVHAGNGAVWAVGTSFNVSHNKEFVDVLVSEGKVKVFSRLGALDELPALSASDSAATSPKTALESGSLSPTLRDVLLVAGEAAQYQDGIVSKKALGKAGMDKELAWQVGVLLFDGETLEEAVSDISRYTDQQLVIVDASIRELRVGGRFKTDDIDALLNSLAKSLDITLERGEGRQLLFSAK